MEFQRLRPANRPKSLTAEQRSTVSDWQTTPEPSPSRHAPQPDNTNLLTTETEGKIIIQRSWNGLSWVEWLSHLASIAYTVAVLSLCGLQVYFADITKPDVNTDLNAFQFVAALHAIIVGTSLTAMAV